MIRLVAFLLVVLAFAAGLHWLADRPGTITIEWLGYIAETSMFRALIILAVALTLAFAAWSLLRQVWRSPATVGRYLYRRRQKRGLDALTSGIIAVGAGDRALAVRYAGPGAQGAAARAAHAPAARAGRPDRRRPRHRAAHLRSHARLARDRAARLARLVPRSRARGRARSRPPVRRAGVAAQRQAGLARRIAVRVAVPRAGLASAHYDTLEIAPPPARHREGACRPPPRGAADGPGPGARGCRRRQGLGTGAGGPPAGARSGSGRGHRRPRAGRARQHAPRRPRSAQDVAPVPRIPISPPPTLTPGRATARATVSTACAIWRA